MRKDEIPRLNLNQFKPLKQKGKVKEINLICQGGIIDTSPNIDKREKANERKR